MTKKGDLAELIKACNEILKIAKKHSYLWENSKCWKKYEDEKRLLIGGGWIAQDETFDICVEKKGNQFVFSGSHFCNDEKGYNAKQVATEIVNNFSGYDLTPEKLMKGFRNSLKKPLGIYLANKCLEGKI